MTPVVAITVVTDDATARIGKTGTLALGGDLDATATLKGKIETTAEGDTQSTNTGVGISLALTVDNSNANATTERNITAGGGVSFGAHLNASSKSDAKASVIGGESEDSSTPSNGVDQKTGKELSFADSKAKEKDNTKKGVGTATAPSAEAPNESGGTGSTDNSTKISVAGAVGINIASTGSHATIPDGLTINAGGALGLSASNNTDASASADASATVPKASNNNSSAVGVGAAVAINVANVSNTATIGAANVTANGVKLEAVMTDVNGDKTHTFGAAAKSGAGGGTIGVAGAVGISVDNVHTEASIATGASVNAGAGDVGLTAESRTSSTVTALPNNGGASGTNVGVGVSVGVNVGNYDTHAAVNDGATLTGGANMALSATGDHKYVTQVEAGAESAGSSSGGGSGSSGGGSSGIGVAPAVAVTVANNDTEARLGTGSGVNPTGNLSITADHKSNVTTSAGGDAAGAQVAVGAAVAVTVANDSAIASTERDIAAGGAVTLSAHQAAASNTSAKASAKGGKSSSSSPSDGVDQNVGNKRGFGDTVASHNSSSNSGSTASPTASTSSGSVSVAAAIGVNIANADARATIADGLTIGAGDLLTVSSSTNTDANAKADATAVTKASSGAGGSGGSGGGGGSSAVGVGAAVALNVASSTAEGRIGDDDVTAKGVKVEAVMTPVALPKQGTEKLHSFGAQATSGAGGGDIGVAGSVAINIATSNAEASIDAGATLALSGGELTLTAENLSKDIVTAKPASTPATSGKDVGVGASVALDVASDTTRAEIEDGARITGTAGEGSITATNAHDASIEAENGATSSGGTAVGAAVAIGVLTNTTTARFGADDGSTSADDLLAFTGGVTVAASHTATVTTLAHGEASGSTAVGVSVALNVIEDDTKAALDHSVDAVGSVAVTAGSVTDSKAESRASAGGAPKGGNNSQQELDSQNGFANSKSGKSNTSPSIQDNMNTGDSQSSSKTGAGSSSSVGVAAAIGVDVDISNTQASVKAGTKVLADGSVKVASSSDTDASALAIGTAVNITDQNSTAVGAAVAVNVATLTNKATVGDGAQIEGAGITVQAVMPDDPAKQVTAAHEFSTRALAGAAGQETSVAGSVAVDVQSSDTQATVGTGAKLTSTGGLNVDAVNRIQSQNIAGSGALSTSNTSVGASVVVNVITGTTIASIGDNSTVDASGAMVIDATGSITPIDGDIPADPMSVAAGGAVSGDGVAVAGSVDVNIISSTTHASLGNGIVVNGTLPGGATQTIAVTASDTTKVVGAAGSLAGSLSSTGIGAGVEVDVITKDTRATIGTGSTIDASGSLVVTATSSENVLSVAGAIGLGDSVGVAAGADVLVITQTTDAHIGASSNVQTGGAIGIGASDTQERHDDRRQRGGWR